MAAFNIVKRTKANGEKRYLCTVRVKQKGVQVYSESRTFTKEAPARAWGKKKTIELERDGHEGQNASITLGDLIQKYFDDSHIEFKRTKQKVLEMLQDCDIAKLVVNAIKPHHIIQHCKDRKEAKAQPQTINHDVSYIRWCLKNAKPMYGYDVNDSVVVDAYAALHELNLIGKSNRRSRRPTSVELNKLVKALEKRESKRNTIIPFVDILNFSILSCMRIGEVCSILWEDLDKENKAVLVRDRKDPRKKTGNHMLVPLLGDSFDIVLRQPQTDARIFPYNARSVTSGFQRVRNANGIIDLRYHDMRREGASRLFEMGYTIDEVAQVTGHRNINTLWQVYTELYPKRLHDKFSGN